MAMTTERISGFRITDEALSDSRLYFFFISIYLVASGFNCSMCDLLCIMWNHSLEPTDSLVVAREPTSAQHLWGTSLVAPQNVGS